MKNLIRLENKDLINIVQEALCILSEENDKKLSVCVITDKNEIQDDIDIIWELMQISYQNIGGFKTAKTPKDLLRNTSLIKIVEHKDAIIACATYREMGGYKMTGIACDQTDIGKEAMKLIIQDDISNFDMWYWVEASGAVEHLFKKFNGYPLPNTYVPMVLNVNQNIELSDDGVHYIRFIGLDKTPYEKMIFGFRDKELYERVQNEMENYDNFMEDVNMLKEYYERYPQHINSAIHVIENIHRLHYEEEFNEIPKKWYVALERAYKTLEREDVKDGTIQQYIDTAYYLMHELVVLELNVFQFVEV